MKFIATGFRGTKHSSEEETFTVTKISRDNEKKKKENKRKKKRRKKKHSSHVSGLNQLQDNTD